MKSMEKAVNIPKFLQELHGKQARRIDLIVTYLAAVAGTLFTLYLAQGVSMPLYKKILLAILAFDISGGVVANFTVGTQNYFSEKTKLRYKFISMHLLHPIILLWVFPKDLSYIVVTSTFTLLAITLINRIANRSTQKAIASFLAFVGVALSFILTSNQPMVHFLMVLFVIKLVIGFSIKWE